GVIGDHIAWAAGAGARFDGRSEFVAHPWAALKSHDFAHEVGGALIDHPWELVERNGVAITEDFALWAQRPAAGGLHGVSVLGSVEQLFVDPEARVEPHVLLDATRGPIVIDRAAVVL